MQPIYPGAGSFCDSCHANSGTSRSRLRRNILCYDFNVHRLLNEFLHGHHVYDYDDVRHRTIFQCSRYVCPARLFRQVLLKSIVNWWEEDRKVPLQADYADRVLRVLNSCSHCFLLCLQDFQSSCDGKISWCHDLGRSAKQRKSKRWWGPSESQLPSTTGCNESSAIAIK